jgi:hypothetical protein
MRRTSIAAVALAVVTVTAGCGFLLGTESLSFSASPATVGDSALSETGYEETNVTEQTASREFTVADQTRTVELTNHLAQYERQAELGELGSQPAGVFTVFATPEVEVAGQTFNPIQGLSERDVAEQFQSNYEGISVGERTGNVTMTALGADRTVEQFDGTATLGGADVDVVIEITKFKHGSDYVVALAVYPERLDGEHEHVVTMLEGLEHEASEGGGGGGGGY